MGARQDTPLFAVRDRTTAQFPLSTPAQRARVAEWITASSPAGWARLRRLRRVPLRRGRAAVCVTSQTAERSSQPVGPAPDKRVPEKGQESCESGLIEAVSSPLADVVPVAPVDAAASAFAATGTTACHFQVQARARAARGPTPCPLLMLDSHDGPNRDSIPGIACYVTIRHAFLRSSFGPRGAIRETAETQIAVGITWDFWRKKQNSWRRNAFGWQPPFFSIPVAFAVKSAQYAAIAENGRAHGQRRRASVVRLQAQRRGHVDSRADLDSRAAAAVCAVPYAPGSESRADPSPPSPL
ncbi:hypothetical protein HPB50_008901 [Hyalomma asiaticum]|uniref:Uncharacterized protein n=1 Tax=Hyalomma asiaticum TaxID=266040 RepID=A0ACB7RVL9_HYAAI|nr:hypothetical protein HPB50_008901 [Hyalomma asiaticum]